MPRDLLKNLVDLESIGAILIENPIKVRNTGAALANRLHVREIQKLHEGCLDNIKTAFRQLRDHIFDEIRRISHV